MKIVPVIKSGDLERSVQFYTRILDFERKWPGHEDREMANGVIDLIRDGAELQLSRHVGDGVFGSVKCVFVDDVDKRYLTFRTSTSSLLRSLCEIARSSRTFANLHGNSLLLLGHHRLLVCWRKRPEGVNPCSLLIEIAALVCRRHH